MVAYAFVRLLACSMAGKKLIKKAAALPIHPCGIDQYVFRLWVGSASVHSLISWRFSVLIVVPMHDFRGNCWGFIYLNAEYHNL